MLILAVPVLGAGIASKPLQRVVRCIRGHRVDSNLICGTSKSALPKTQEKEHHVGNLPKKPVRDLLPAVVVVGLWDPKTKAIRIIGSGFIVDNQAQSPVDLSARWNISDPTYAYNRLHFLLDYQVNDFIEDHMSSFSLWDRECQ